MGHYLSEMGGRFTLQEELALRNKIIASGKDPDKPYFAQLSENEYNKIFRK